MEGGRKSPGKGEARDFNAQSKQQLLLTMLIQRLILMLALASLLHCSIVPTTEIMIFPNTEGSPSLYIISFQVGNSMAAGEYMLISLDWLTLPIDPHHCNFVNSSLMIRCTSMQTPDFALPFEAAALLLHNDQLVVDRTLAVQLTEGLVAGAQYVMEFTLRNQVENIAKISPSMEIYLINTDGLVYEENMNFGSIVYKPPITDLLDVSILTDLSQNIPGSLSTLKVEISIGVNVQTSLSTIWFTLQEPFEFSESSYVRVDESEDYSTNPIALNSEPSVLSSEIKSKHLFFVVFNEQFVVNRKFIIEVTEIKNPFFIADSNISIYSSNFNSLTPLEAFESLYPLACVTQSLAVTLGLPYDIPIQGPCVFYRSNRNHYKVTFNMPLSIPAGYAMRIEATDNTIYHGTGYINIESLDYTPQYEYFSSQGYFIIKSMGPVDEGALIYILFKASKGSVTNFNVRVMIDTEQIIQAGTASTYMFDGSDDGQSEDAQDFYYGSQFEDSSSYENERPTIDLPTNQHIRLRFIIRNATSSGSYLEMYLSPYVEFDPSFSELTDCRFENWANSCRCTVTKTSNFVHMKFEAISGSSWESSYPNTFGNGASRYLYIYKMKLMRYSDNKYPYPVYFTLSSHSGVNPTKYIERTFLSVLPRLNSAPGLTVELHGNTQNLDTRYPSFVRMESLTPATFDYTVEENEVKIISLRNSRGYRGLGTYANGAQYPCASNMPIKCYFRQGDPQAYTNWFQEWDSIDIFFQPNSTETTDSFHIIVPDSNTNGNYDYITCMIGVYNLFTKETKFYKRTNTYTRNSWEWITVPNNLYAAMTVDFEGKAGSYRDNVTVTVATGGLSTSNHNFLVVTSTWSMFENDISGYTAETDAMTNPVFYSGELSPLSLYLKNTNYMAVFPFTIPSSLSTFSFYLDNLHMPYHYDLPNCYMYTIDAGNNFMSAYNAFEMTNQNIFYEAFLKSLTISCEQNFLGVQNTFCTVTFGTQSPLRANGKIRLVLSGMNIATDDCDALLPNGTALEESCSSTQNNKNVTISLVDTYDSYQYPADNFTVVVHGVSIEAEEISQSMTLYLYDNTGNYVIEKGTRILTTTVAQPADIEIYEIIYDYLSPLSANKISISFFLPRGIYDDERLGFVMGKDLSDVNSEVKRMRIVLTRNDGLQLEGTHELISNEYKVLFTFKDRSQLISSNYTLKIYGIMTPASHENGAFSIIFQRNFDKGFTLINSIETSFPEFADRIASNITMQAFFNTEGYQQEMVFTLLNSEDAVNSQMIWVVNFPSYYSENLFNFDPYCLIDSAPIECYADPTTPYQLIIKLSPKIIPIGTPYTLSILRLTCPRAKYTNDYYQSRYLFIGMIAEEGNEYYSETALLYPEQGIQEYVDGILTITDLSVSTSDFPTFSSLYTIMFFKCNLPITATSILYLIFPLQFDNFNNNPIDYIVKTSTNAILASGQAQVIDRRLEIPIPTVIAANALFKVEFPSLPTPKFEATVSMSETIGYVTNSGRTSIYAATTTSTNSAPKLTFTADDRYLSFNHDQTITITAGTYSNMIDISSSDGEEFLTNIQVNISSVGFTFEPESVFLKLGDEKGQFRVGADSGLLPISYFYQTSKSEQVFTYYTITKNNNIKVTNTPVSVTIPTSIDVPIGGCSQPVIVDILNPPVDNVGISFNYDNAKYSEELFWPNYHTTKSEMLYSPSATTNVMSFCVHSSYDVGVLGSSFDVRLVLIGTNYRSYAFSPSQNLTINVIGALTLPAPTVSLQAINIQKTFLDFNITINSPGIVYHYIKIGQNVQPMEIIDIQVKIKNHREISESMQDFMDSRIYTQERDEKVGLVIRDAGQFTLRISDLLPERYYTFCVFLENSNSVISDPSCLSIQTQQWGTIMKAKISFTSALSDQNLNKILCFFTKAVDTEVLYMVDLEGNSCHDRSVANLYYSFPGQIFSSENRHTVLYMVSNPYLTSDPSPTAFLTLFGNNKELTAMTLASAVSGFAINYLSATYISSYDAIDLMASRNPQTLSVSFTQPEYSKEDRRITIRDVRLLGGYGSVYFLVVLFKEIQIDGNNSYVNIRLNQKPSQEQMLNCETWEGIRAEGCARSISSYSSQIVTFESIKPDCMYVVYYAAASEYPLRPILSSNIENETVVTFVAESSLIFPLLFFLALAMTL